MTPAELLAIPPSELAQLDDTQLANLLAPLFPSVRAEYCGPREKDAIRLPNGNKVSQHSVQRDAATLLNMLKANGITLPTSPVNSQPQIID